MTKKAKTFNEAWSIQETYEDKPHGWIQWKGTDACIDLYCKCGSHLHHDGSHMYCVKCMDCGTIYFINGHVELIEIEDSEGFPIIELSEDDDLLWA